MEDGGEAKQDGEDGPCCEGGVIVVEGELCDSHFVKKY
jgi:hypothetical protein